MIKMTDMMKPIPESLRLALAAPLLVAAFAVHAGPNQTNLPDCPTHSDTKQCPCADGETRVDNGCIRISLGMGSTTPWTGSRSAAIKVFTENFGETVFTPECLFAVVGYTFNRIGKTVVRADGVYNEVVFSHPDGEPVVFSVKEGESSAAPDGGRHGRMDERLMLVDSQGWACPSDPVYYDLYETDGTVRRFHATNRSGELGRLVHVKDSRGVVTTPEDMGVDFVRDADGLRQFLTPSRLADVRLREGGYDLVIYPLQSKPAKDPATGLYALPSAAPVYTLAIRRGTYDRLVRDRYFGGVFAVAYAGEKGVVAKRRLAELYNRYVYVTLTRGASDPEEYRYYFTDGDWTLITPSGVRKAKTKSIDDGVSARITSATLGADGSRLKSELKNYRWYDWGYAMTDLTEGFGDATEITRWTYVTSGPAAGCLESETLGKGLCKTYDYDAVKRRIRETRSGVGMATNVIEYSYASVDPSDVVPPVDSRPRMTVKKVDGVEVERTYHVYGPWSETTERAASQGAAYGAAGAMRTVRTYWDAVSGVKAGKLKSIRREDGKVDAYDYTLVTNVWTETVTHLHEQAMDPVSGKTTRDISVTNARGETLEYRTEAYIGGNWYTISKTMQQHNLLGKVIRSTDLAGRVTTTAWDCCHKISETKPDGRITTWDYDAEGRMIASSRLIPLDMTNVTWVTTCYSYDGLGRQTATWTTNYTAHIGTPATTTSYDGLGRVIARADVLGNVTTTSYSPDGRTVSVSKPNGATIITTRNSDGDTLSITGTGVTPEFYTYGVLPDGTRWSRMVQGETADSPRFTKSYENLLGQTVRSEKSGFRGAILASVNTYDNYSRLVSTTSDGEPTSEITYDALGNRIATTTLVGGGLRPPRNDGPREWRKSESHSAYALLGNDVWAIQTNVVSCSDATITPLMQSRAERVTGLTASLLSQSLLADIRGNVSESRVEYNGFETIGINISPAQTGRAESHSRLGVAVRSVSASGVESRSLFDGLGRVCTSIDGRGNATRAEYDAFGRQLATIDADNKRTTYGYDALGQLVRVTNPLGDAVTYAYDLRGHKTYEGGATYPVRYAYDLFGNKVSMTTYRDEDAQKGDVTQWLYDETSGSVTNKVYADGKGPAYDYDARGRITKRTWARGIETTYTYDDWGSLTRTDYSDDTPSIVLSYDAMGRQTRAIDAAGTTTFAYDVFGSLINETVVGVAGTNTIERFYDTFGRDAGYALNGIRQSVLGYDPSTGRLATMRIPSIEDFNHHSPTPSLNSNSFTWNYLDGSDLKSSLAYPNGLTASWTYGNRGELLEVNNASPTGTISRYVYTYDAAGRRVACAKSGTAFEQSDSVNYGYNARSELTNAAATVDAAYRYGYDFDDIGNRKTSAERGTDSVYTANSLNQYASITNISTFQLSNLPTFQPTFDADGNQTLVKTATGIWQVSYNGENRPVRWEQIEQSEQSTNRTIITMSYDRMGRRVTKNDQRFVYNGYLQIANFRSTTTTSDYNYFIWDPTEPVATRPLVWHHGSSVAYYTHDGNKNVSEVIDSNNDVAAHYEYAPFGALTVSRGVSAAANPWRFSSEYAEDDTATVYYNYRHYEPVMGRWMRRDPIEDEGGVNCYISCLNDTVMYFDVCGWYGSNLPGVLQWGYCEDAYNYALKHLHTPQERAAWERYTNHGWRSADRNIHLSPEDVQHIAMSINAVSVYIKRKRESCKNGGKFEDSTSIGGNAPAPWVLAIGGVSININASCDDGCFSYCLSINDLYDFDIKGIPGFTSRSAKGEIVTWLVSISETCLQCDWATFYHVGSFCGRD